MIKYEIYLIILDYRKFKVLPCGPSQSSPHVVLLLIRCYLEGKFILCEWLIVIVTLSLEMSPVVPPPPNCLLICITRQLSIAVEFW